VEADGPLPMDDLRLLEGKLMYWPGSMMAPAGSSASSTSGVGLMTPAMEKAQHFRPAWLAVAAV
jgi:hypothetical protein